MGLFSFLDKDFVYERAITIERPAAQVWSYVKSLENFKNWNPFLLKDPNTKISLKGTDSQPGFVMGWQGNRDVGSGEQEIKKIIEGERVEFELRFFAPFKATNEAFFAVESISASQARVRWQMSGKTIFPMSLIGRFVNFDKMIGVEFETGLGRLKAILEK